MPSRWIYRSKTSFDRAEEFAEELGVSPLVVDILYARGLTGLADMDRFLSPGLRHLPEPEAIPGLDQAARVLAREIAAGKTPAVWGDYDVDGVTASALMLDFFAHSAASRPCAICPGAARRATASTWRAWRNWPARGPECW